MKALLQEGPQTILYSHPTWYPARIEQRSKNDITKNNQKYCNHQDYQKNKWIANSQVFFFITVLHSVILTFVITDVQQFSCNILSCLII